MQRDADAVVVTWLDSLPPESIWTTSITVFEVRFGLEILASGRRRRLLEEAFGKMLEEDFEGRIVPFDDAARTPQRKSPRSGAGSAVPSKSATCRSPRSPRRVRPRWQRATCATFRDAVRS